MKDDRNIERFFKKRLESNEFSYQEKDWEDLEKKLDAAGIAPPGNNLLFSPVKLVVTGLIISSVAFFLGWFIRDSIGQEQVTAETALPARTNSKITVENNDIPVHVPTEDKAKHEQHEAGLPSGASKSLAGLQNPSEQPHNVSEGNVIFSLEPAEQGMERVEFEPFEDLHQVKAGPVAREIIGEGNFLPVAGEEKPAASSTSLSFKDRWSVGLSVAPDLNSIGLSERKSFSPKFGGQIFYRLSERWIISAGAYYNKKKYNTDAEGYSPPEGYWYYGTNGVKPSTIIGSCGVVDVPVKVYYRWNDAGRFEFYSSVGLSNYFLLDEAYEFEFSRPNPGSEKGWYTEENSSVIAGVANASVIVSLQLSERSALLAEPYLQAPLTKIGWGNVDLFSTGLLFTFRYKLFRPAVGQKMRNK